VALARAGSRPCSTRPIRSIRRQSGVATLGFLLVVVVTATASAARAAAVEPAAALRAE
jgi:hypothetical protein